MLTPIFRDEVGAISGVKGHQTTPRLIGVEGMRGA